MEKDKLEAELVEKVTALMDKDISRHNAIRRVARTEVEVKLLEESIFLEDAISDMG